MRAARQWVLILLLLTSLIGAVPVQAVPVKAQPIMPQPVMQSTALSLLAPNGCPSTGCPGGQRLSMRFTFIPTVYDPAANQTVKICVYAPKGWDVNLTNRPGLTVSSTGQVSGKPYTNAPSPSCAAADTSIPSNYNVVIEADATLDPSTPSDALDFSFRLGSAAAGNGQVLTRLFEQDATGWHRTANVTSSVLAAAPTTGEVYVANDPSTCGSNNACYTNSIEDLTLTTNTGIGTGLKDAADVAPSKITVLGSYSIQSKTVHLTNPLTLTGRPGATITYNGPTGCPIDALISLDAPIRVEGLNINDGNCLAPGRHLLEVNNPNPAAAVFIISNNLTHGNHAIEVNDTGSTVVVQFNNITDNDGYALFAKGHSQGGGFSIAANNLNHNNLNDPTKPFVDCSAAATTVIPGRRADHNYWGSGLPGDTTLTHCSINSGKVLGMPIVVKSSSPGVDAQQVIVNTTQTYAFDSQISYFRTGGTADFPLYIVNHGYLTDGGPPFTYAKGLTGPIPCSNYWDIFLPEGTNPDGKLELYFKYNKSTACIATINSTQYCDQTTTPGKYPLYWYDPATGLTTGWDTTGSHPDNLTSSPGQTTTCHTSTNEIQVTLDNDGRPDLTHDLSYLPFMVGIPVLKSFVPLASNKLVTVSWATNNEPDISGFVVYRGESATTLGPITDLITHTGTALVGKTYSYLDQNRTNGVTYYYRLEIVRTDGEKLYSDIKAVTANVATITPTFTPRPTSTATEIRPTATRIFTQVPTSYPTRLMTATAIFRFGQGTPSRTPTLGTPGTLNPLTLTARVRTLTGSGTPRPANALTLTATAQTPGPLTLTAGTGTLGIGTPGTGTPGTGTPGVSLTPTPTPTASPTGLVQAAQPAQSNPHPWLSLLLGLLAGAATASAIGGAWWYLRGRHIV